MDYRIVYNDSDVLSAVEHNENNVTYSNQKFIIDTLEDAVRKLTAWGVNVSLLWKDDLIDRMSPDAANPEINISDHPDENEDFQRRVFVKSLAIDHEEKAFTFGLIVRHFANGVHDTETFDDEFVSTKVDNSVLVPGGNGMIGEYDYFLELIEGGASLIDIERERIPIMDGNNFFDGIYG